MPWEPLLFQWDTYGNTIQWYLKNLYNMYQNYEAPKWNCLSLTKMFLCDSNWKNKDQTLTRIIFYINWNPDGKCWCINLAIWMIYISNLSILMKRGITEDIIIQWPLGGSLTFLFWIFSFIFHKGYSDCVRSYLLHLVSLWKHQWVSMYETQKANQTVRMYSHSPKRKTTQSSLVPPSVVPNQHLSLLVVTRVEETVSL